MQLATIHMVITLLHMHSNYHEPQHNKTCENTLIERTPKTIFKASFGLKKLPRSSFNAPKTIIEV